MLKLRERGERERVGEGGGERERVGERGEREGRRKRVRERGGEREGEVLILVERMK